MNKKIAFVIHNLVLYHTIRNLYSELVKEGFNVIIYVIDSINQVDWLDMFDSTYQQLKSYANVFKSSEYGGEEYDIAFYPYLPYGFEVQAKYKIRYQYGMAKPVWNFKAETVLFDYCLCYGNYDYAFLQYYCEAKIIGNIKYAHLSSLETERYVENNPVHVLYLPTYGRESSLDLIVNDVLSLPSDWKIYVKLHHGTEFLEYDRKNQISKLDNVAVYGQNDLLENLILKCDIVISDGSSACFDAIYFCKPLIIAGEFFGDDFYGEEPITKQLFTKYGMAKYVHNRQDLALYILNLLMDGTYVKKIRELRDYFFPIRGRDTLELVTQLVTSLDNNVKHSYNAVKKATQIYLEKMISNNRVLNDIYTKHDAVLLELSNTQVKLNSTQAELINAKLELSLIKNGILYRFLRYFKRLFMRTR